jgi:hypothetical protein
MVRYYPAATATRFTRASVRADAFEPAGDDELPPTWRSGTIIICTAAATKSGGGRFLGTTLVLAEFHAHLLHLRGPGAARNALNILLDDPAHTWVEVPTELIRSAAAGWLARFLDQDFSSRRRGELRGQAP